MLPSTEMVTVLIGLYVACELISNVTAGKPVAIAGIVVPAAVFLYILSLPLISAARGPSRVSVEHA